MYRHILVPLAFDEAHEPEPALAVARQLSGDDTRVSLLHVMPEVPGYAISYMPEGYREELEQAIRSELETLARGFGSGAGVLASGDAGRVILDWSGQNGVDCIVIASHRPGLQDYLLGSTAARVVRHAACSVHVLR
ncbi:universal stress protein [Rhodobacter veldkampii DSM 11550]|uniref:Universal stress protein n=1 Tax=Phaeovulum veldkampii DSM 11550 TaxID=1185920 RepID=A0A2T4JFL2_9RHOB|nr:universal stress protein [Phaeovulum veldkampii]MBK5945311.1 universal stress protein [Phaeovulum veldkampii DSM 11550]NCU21662.1 universal stress protein [Candidatus Falkowbacteria bacterium]PTE16702.1 universal stress protein [Phaeovulum veldkampii DSM 11550]TDQ60305.1 nucleotide-binding universal stress UspA family protein [Phaeovulum veldkampii DSM 11550]